MNFFVSPSVLKACSETELPKLTAPLRINRVGWHMKAPPDPPWFWKMFKGLWKVTPATTEKFMPPQKQTSQQLEDNVAGHEATLRMRKAKVRGEGGGE